MVEVVLAVQFPPLRGLHNGRLGLLWREMMADYPNASDAAPISPVTEDFGDEAHFGMPGIEFAQARGDSRLRMVSADGSRMIQVQNGWLVANWMKRAGQPYPGYSGVLVQFEEALATFRKLAADQGLGEVAPSTWEVTYIDHIPCGTVWRAFSEIPAVAPGLLSERSGADGGFEAFTGTWAYRLRSGRLRVSLQTARSSADPPVDLLVMTTTARGPITTHGHEALVESLNSGHMAAVERFMAVTSPEAQGYWKG